MSGHSDTRLYSERVGEALMWAAEIHATQTRKGKREPYLSHILAVTSLAAHYGGSEDQIIAAALHDSVEDAGGEQQALEIGRRFGPNVEYIVRECSDVVAVDPSQPKPPWRERKETAIAGLAQRAPSDVDLVEACDKLANLRDITEDLDRYGEATLERFNGGPEGVLWYYRELLRVLGPRVPAMEPELTRLVDRLGDD